MDSEQSRELKEHLADIESCDDGYCSMPDYTKEKINELVWTCMPGTMTLARAEQIACAIFEMFRDEYEMMNAEKGILKGSDL